MLAGVGFVTHDHQEQRQITEMAIIDTHKDDDHKLCSEYNECKETGKCKVFQNWEDQCKVLEFFDNQPK